MTYDELVNYFVESNIEFKEINQDQIYNFENEEDTMICLKKIDDDSYSVNGKIAIEIKSISTKYNKEDDIEIKNQEDVFMGLLCFKENINYKPINQLTEWQLTAFYKGINNQNLSEPISYDYLIIDENLYSDYINEYKESAPIWGGFSHEDIVEKPYNKVIDNIVAVKGIKYPTITHKNNAIWAINQIYVFERFLKLYHMLELVFYYDWVQGIKNLNDNTLFEVEKFVMFNKEEISQLNSIITKRCRNIETVVNHMNKYSDFKETCNKIFFEYGKTSNPIKEKQIDKFNTLIESKDFGFDNYKDKMGNVNYNQDNYKNDIVKLVSYWIYRVRCSIAHNKIGEYILTHRDEQFMVEFIEPLIVSLVSECFREE